MLKKCAPDDVRVDRAADYAPSPAEAALDRATLRRRATAPSAVLALPRNRPLPARSNSPTMRRQARASGKRSFRCAHICRYSVRGENASRSTEHASAPSLAPLNFLQQRRGRQRRRCLQHRHQLALPDCFERIDAGATFSCLTLRWQCLRAIEPACGTHADTDLGRALPARAWP